MNSGIMQRINGISLIGQTDLGKIRTNNEDAYVVQYIWDRNNILAVVIDGVGGYEGGEVASDIAQKCIVGYLTRYTHGERIDLLKQAVIYANNTIYAERKRKSGLENMSCVLTAVLIELEQRRVNMAHIGDTRLYQYAHGELIKLSHDHSLVGYREEIGNLTEEEAMRHPQRNVIGRDVGSTFLEENNRNYIELETFPLLSHSVLLLCSDGLYDMLTSAQIKEILEKKVSLNVKANALIRVANDAGGQDNVTVVLVETMYEESESDACEKSTILSYDLNGSESRERENEIIPTEFATSYHAHRKSRIKRFCLLFLYSIVLWTMGYVCGKYLSVRMPWEVEESDMPTESTTIVEDDKTADVSDY